MRALIFILVSLSVTCAGLSPVAAQFNGNDLFRLGIQILNGTDGAGRPSTPGMRREYPPGPAVQPRSMPPDRGASARSDTMVAEVQTRLNDLGYAVGDVDGEAGARTRLAISNFQRDRGLPQTGEASASLLQALRLAQGQPAAGASFDCRVARRPAERAICASTELVGLDREMSGAYASATASGTTSRTAQTAWINRRNACGSNTGCIAAAYRQRLAELGNAGSATFATATTRQPAGNGTFTRYDGYDLPGGDYRSGLSDPGLRGIGPEACQQLCVADGRCRGFTYNTRADLCILKDAVTQRARFAGAISGTRDAGAAGPAGAPGDPAVARAVPGYDIFVHLALMSDTEAYLAEAATTGLAYVYATGSEAQCKQFAPMARIDEFARRDLLAQSAAIARSVIASLPGRPRRVERPVEAIYTLGEYDFERQGFPIPATQHAQLPILAPGNIALADGERPLSCRVGSSALGSGSATRLTNLVAAHDGVPGVDFLPMSVAEARAFRARSGGKVKLKAMVQVEPRDQGRGPLKGEVTAVSAYEIDGERRLHTWTVDRADTHAPQRDLTPWSGSLLAALVSPYAASIIAGRNFDAAAARYFRYHEQAIRAGNLPPESPLPLDVMRGQQPEVIAALNREQLHVAFRKESIALPKTVTVDQRMGPMFDESKGLTLPALENGVAGADVSPMLANVKLSSRDLPLYERFPFLSPWANVTSAGFREAVLSGQAVRIVLELDRIAYMPAVPMKIEQAAARGLVGYSARQRDSIVVRWTFDIREVRSDAGAIVVSAALRELSYRWASDNALLAQFPAATFTTVAALRGLADAALPKRATADNIVAPPAGTRFSAEMMDLLQLRFVPETVDDRIIERMMITRFAYEAALAGRTDADNKGSADSKGPPDDNRPLWGNFFPNARKFPGPDERAASLEAFRAWSRARAAALPASLTIVMALGDTPQGKMAPFERRTPHPHASNCRSVGQRPGTTASEKDIAGAKLCAFLEAAWQPADPLLFSKMGTTSVGNLRSDCRDVDPYCREMYNAHVALKLPPGKVQGDFVLVDRLPTLDATMRGAQGDVAVAIEVEPQGVTAQTSLPSGLWGDALAEGLTFDNAHGLQIVRAPDPVQRDEPYFIVRAKTKAARLIDTKTGRVLAALSLAEPAELSRDLLEMPASKADSLDVLGIKLGMAFPEAEALIRAHMPVGKVLTADRARQLGTVSGDLVPYTSGRIYASDKGDELVAIFDEPPAAPAVVLGVWRILRLPQGGADPAGLKATLSARYGPPLAVEEVSLPFMNKGIGFRFADFPHPRCSMINFGYQPDLWRDENGNGSWLPPFMTSPLFPILAHPTAFDAVGRDGKPALADQCPAFLGVRYARYDGRNAGAPAGDEIVTWLTDQRRYAKAFHESRKAISAAPPPARATGTDIKF